MDKSAYQELVDYLHGGEEVEAVAFGNWGEHFLGGGERVYPARYPCTNEPGISITPTVPIDRRGEPLLLSAAREFMEGWSFEHGFGSTNTYSVYVWTNKRVIFVHAYDGSTQLASVPRNPERCLPAFSGEVFWTKTDT